MPLARYQAFAQDEAGNVLGAASIEVRNELSGSLAPLFSDRAGSVALANPFAAGADGYFGFHAIGGAYKITVTKDAVTRTFRYVGVGTNSEYDFGASGATPQLDNLSAVAINTSLLPGSPDAIALGSVTATWSDLFLGDGGIINWNANVVLAHSAGFLTLIGGALKVPDAAYDATAWNENFEVPTKNALRDKIETLGGGQASGIAFTPTGGVSASNVQAAIVELDTEKAPIASPVFTGNPTAPTPAADDNDTSVATTAFVIGQAGAANPVINGTAAPGVSLKYSRQDHVHPTDSSRAPIASPVFTGDPQAPTPATGDNDTSVATTAFVKAQGYATVASPTFTGDPKAPTPAADDNDTSIATTAFVAGQAGVAAPAMDGAAAAGTSLKYSRQDHVHPTDTTRAPLASPTFTGDPKAPTPTVDDNDTSVATTAFVIGQASAVADGTPAMDGAAARGTAIHWARADHVHPTDTTRAPLASPTFTGDPQAPTPATGDNDTSIATTAFVKAQGYAPLASPVFTGNPTAPTPTPGDNDTSIATTAFVAAAVAAGGGGGGANTNLSNLAAVAINAALTPGVTDTIALGSASFTWSDLFLGPAGTINIGGVAYEPATAAQYINNTANKLLTTDKVWAAAAPASVGPVATYAPDFNFAIDHYWTLNSATGTLSNPTNAKAGQKGVIYIVQDGTGGRLITTWGSALKFPGGVKPTLSAAAGAVDAISYSVVDSTHIYCTFQSGFA